MRPPPKTSLPLVAGNTFAFAARQRRSPDALPALRAIAGVEGLGIIPGQVRRFDDTKLTVPHIGWNGLNLHKNAPLLEGMQGSRVYFVHSFRAVPDERNTEWIAATCAYGAPFAAAVQKGAVNATQFHPEKSGAEGLRLMARHPAAPLPLRPPQLLSPPVSQCPSAQRSASLLLPVRPFFPPFQNRFLSGATDTLTPAATGAAPVSAPGLARRVIACLDVRANDNGDLVVTKGDSYDVREASGSKDVRNLGKPVELAGRYFQEGADEVTFLNITVRERGRCLIRLVLRRQRCLSHFHVDRPRINMP